MSSEQKYTSPRAMGSSKAAIGSFGAVGKANGVSLPQYGGEGGDKYKGQKSDMSLDQKGGEGGGKTGTVAKKTDMGLLLKNPEAGYNGEGRFLKKA